MRLFEHVSGLFRQVSGGMCIAFGMLVPHWVTAAPQSTVTFPGEVVLGEDFSIGVSFSNVGPMGFAPFIQVATVAAGEDGIATAFGPPCDGLMLKSASIVGVNGGPLTLSPGSAPATCPYSATSVSPPGIPPGASSAITTPGGWQVHHIDLPFGSYDSSEPPIPVRVIGTLSKFARQQSPLKICVRGGFRFDALPAGNPVFDHSSSLVTDWNCGEVVPVVIKTSKVKSPKIEGEAVSGPSFQGLYPLKYELSINLADMTGAPDGYVENLVLTEAFPTGMIIDLGTLQVAWVGGTTSQVASSSACSGQIGVLEYYVISSTPTLAIGFCGKVVGTPASSDINISFGFYLGSTASLSNCASKELKNRFWAEADWHPTDINRDLVEHLFPASSTSTDTLTGQCVALQKKVEGDIKPGGTLTVSLKFQFSDYKTFGQIRVSDVLSNGQSLVPGSASLSITDQTGSWAGGFSSANIGVGNFSPNFQTCAPAKGPHGGTQISFNVSGQMSGSPSLLAGYVIGGLAWGLPAGVGAIGEISFQVKVADTYTGSAGIVSPHDTFIDKHDLLCNRARLEARVYKNVTRPALPSIPDFVVAIDGSKTALALPGGKFEKDVRAVRRGGAIVCGPGGPVCPPSPVDVFPYDWVTFGLSYDNIPTGDAEGLNIREWLPLPSMPINTIGVTPWGWQWPQALNIAGPTLQNTLVSSPAPSASLAAGNSFKLTYPNFNDPSNLPAKVDLIHTVAVSNAPTVDKVLQTNVAQECEDNSFGDTFCQVAVAQVRVRQPLLTIKKGTIRTSNPNSTFYPAPPLPPGIIPLPLGVGDPPNCPRFSAPITSANVGAGFNSDVSAADAQDIITYAIVIENKGGYPAFDVVLEDSIDWGADGGKCFDSNDGALCVRDGTGALLNFTLIPVGQGIWRIHLTAPIPALDSTTSGTGANIVVVTFQLSLKSKILPGCCDNTARVAHYSNTPSTDLPNLMSTFGQVTGRVQVTSSNDRVQTAKAAVAGLDTAQALNVGGDNFIDYFGPVEDKAAVCVGPKAWAKCILRTSEPDTVPNNALPGGQLDGAIGELVRFRLMMSVPEGGLISPVVITDSLPAGLSFVQGSATVYGWAQHSMNSSLPFPTLLGGDQDFKDCRSLPDSQASAAQSVPPTTVSPLTFALGNVQNNDNDPGLEFIVLQYSARIENVASNQGGEGEPPTLLPNSFIACAGNPGQCSVSDTVSVRVVEPTINIKKAVQPPSPLAVGGLATFTITLTNTGRATAYEVYLRDVMPQCLDGPSNITVSSSAAHVTSYPGNPGPGLFWIDIPRMVPAEVVTITFQARIWCTENCSESLTNQASVIWSSLPGPMGTPFLPPASTQERWIYPGAVNDYSARASASLCVPGEICAMKFEDKNGNGSQDPGEPALSGWQFGVSPGSASATTNLDGRACVGVTFPGAYSISEMQQPGWIVTLPPSGIYTGITTSASDWKFGNRRNLEKVCAIKFNDLNGNGVQDVGEPPLGGWTLTLNPGGLSSLTDQDGRACFSVQFPGNYTLGEVQQPGWQQTVPLSGMPYTGISAGTVGLKFGNQRVNLPGQICATKYHDLNGNGIRDSGEPPLSGVSINLNPGGQSQATDASGNVCFLVAVPGSYSVSELASPGWQQTQPAGGAQYNNIAPNTSGLLFGNKKVADVCDLEIKKTRSLITGPSYVKWTVTHYKCWFGRMSRCRPQLRT